MSILFNTEEIHVELSSKCMLKCPRCPRTELKPEFLNREITLDQFKQAFDVTTLAQIKKFVFCGDVGDPIYAKDFLPIVKYIKDNSTIDISIVTNGSYKTAEWWQDLGGMLHKNDQVTFSIDGWDQESNELYRVNSNWDSIMLGLKTLYAHSKCKVKWSAIYFNFNENKILDMLQIARQHGVDTFETVRSSKFGYQYFVNDIDPLQPSADYVSTSSQYQKQTIFVSNHIINVKLQNTGAHPWAKCLRWTKELFINVDGLVFPCPWFNSGYQENDFVQKYSDRMSIKTRSLMDVLTDPMWDEFITRIETMPLEVCKMKCKDSEK